MQSSGSITEQGVLGALQGYCCAIDTVSNMEDSHCQCQEWEGGVGFLIAHVHTQQYFLSVRLLDVLVVVKKMDFCLNTVVFRGNIH